MSLCESIIKRKEGHAMIPLNEFRPVSRLEVPDVPRTRAKFPVIDMHNHLGRTADAAEVLRRMDRFNIAMIADMDGFWDERTDFQLGTYVNRYPGRFALFCRLDMLRVDEPDFAGYVRRRLTDCAAKGAAGVKVSKSLGLKLRGRDGKYLRPDDDRLRAVWEEAAKLGFPVTVHIADPPCFFDKVIDGTHERYEELAEHPDWTYGSRPCPRFGELMEAQENLLSRNPDTRFIVAHVGSHAENLGEVARSSGSIRTCTSIRRSAFRNSGASRIRRATFSSKCRTGCSTAPTSSRTKPTSAGITGSSRRRTSIFRTIPGTSTIRGAGIFTASVCPTMCSERSIIKTCSGSRPGSGRAPSRTERFFQKKTRTAATSVMARMTRRNIFSLSFFSTLKPMKAPVAIRGTSAAVRIRFGALMLCHIKT